MAEINVFEVYADPKMMTLHISLNSNLIQSSCLFAHHTYSMFEVIYR